MSRSFQEGPEFVAFKSPNAVQKNWRSPFEFPYCPQERTNAPIVTYAEKLHVGRIFCRNEIYHSIISEYAKSEDGNTLWIMCKFGDDNAIKPWL